MGPYEGDLNMLIDEPTAWIVVHGRDTAARCKAYLPVPHVWEVHRDDEEYGDLTLVCVLSRGAQYTIDRLASGLIVADGPYATHAEAEARMVEVSF